MKRIPINNFINIIMFFYILSIYLLTFREGLNAISNILALLLIACISIKNLLTKRKFIINKTLGIYMLFIFICLLSVLYAIDQSVAITRVKTLVLIFILMLSIVNYVDRLEKIKKIMIYFVYAGVITCIYILSNSDFSNITRFGDIIGNVNTVGIIIGISLVFNSYFIFEDKKYLYILFALLMFTTIILTGSRTALLFFLINIVIILYLRNQNGLSNKLRFIIIGSAIVIISFYMIYNVPIFYQIIGWRFENIFTYFKGESINETSMSLRAYMIKAGFNMFKKRPLTGYGIDNFRFLFSSLVPGKETYSHNNIIELMVGTGIFGMLTYYLTHIIVLKNLFRSCKYNYNKTMNYAFISLISSFIILSISSVYYYSKHFSIILVVGSCIDRIFKLNKNMN